MEQSILEKLTVPQPFRGHIRLSVFGSERRHQVTVDPRDSFERHVVV